MQGTINKYTETTKATDTTDICMEMVTQTSPSRSNSFLLPTQE